MVRFQRAFEDEQQVLLGDRTARRQADRSLHMGIDDVVVAERISEHDLGDGVDRRVLEIEREAVAGAVGPRRRNSGGRFRESGRRRRAGRGRARTKQRKALRARPGGSRRTDSERRFRREVGAAHRVGGVLRLSRPLLQIAWRAAGESKRSEHREKQAKPCGRGYERATQYLASSMIRSPPPSPLSRQFGYRVKLRPAPGPSAGNSYIVTCLQQWNSPISVRRRGSSPLQRCEGRIH